MDKHPKNQGIDTAPDSGTFLNKLRNMTETRGAKILTPVAILLGIATLSACANEREGAAETPSTSQEAVETPPASEKATEPSLIDDGAVELEPNSYEFVGELLVQQTTFEGMEAMDVSDFAKLSFADRYSYAFDKIVNSYPSVTAETDVLDEYIDFIPGFFWQPAFGISTNSADPNTRAKLAGAFRYYTTEKGDGEISASYQETIDSVVLNGGEGLGADYIFEATDHGELQHGVDRDGLPIDFINMTYRGGSADSFKTAPEQTAQAIRTEIKMLNGETVVFYAIGYGTEGRNSPVEDYPY